MRPGENAQALISPHRHLRVRGLDTEMDSKDITTGECDNLYPDREEFRWLFDSSIRCPGLTQGALKAGGMSLDLSRRFRVFRYKEGSPCLWVVFLGGTGTGKSTLFNAAAARDISETGVERPKTRGPLAYSHRGCRIQRDFPLGHIPLQYFTAGPDTSPGARGVPGHLLVLEHDSGDLSNLVLVDTPDLDSLEEENRLIAEDLYLIADAVVFVTSEEKYADGVPYLFLEKIIGDRRPCYFLLNKVRDGFTEQDLFGPVESQGLTLSPDRVWMIPYSPRSPSLSLPDANSFRDFRRTLLEDYCGERVHRIREEERGRRLQDLETRTGALLDILERENKAALKWRKRLQDLYLEATRELAREEPGYAEEGRKYLGVEIRRLFSRYDVLARPRRFIQSLLSAPFRLFGTGGMDSGGTRSQRLQKIHEKTDLSAVMRVLERFNVSVLEELSPQDRSSPLFSGLRSPDLILGEEEIRARIFEKQKNLEKWLEERFRRLSEELPRTKKWGIYSTSALWGLLILSFETVVGGGLSILDAALDSALAPFVTKGTVELFAYNEIQKITRELASAYREGLASLVGEQRDRYGECLDSLMSPSAYLEGLREFASLLSRNTRGGP